MRRFGSPKVIAVIITALLAPVFSYTVFLYTQRGSEEALIQSIYDRQLKTILFSVNQHCWDMFISWATNFVTLVKNPAKEPESFQISLRRFLEDHPPLLGLCLDPGPGDPFLVWRRSGSGFGQVSNAEILDRLAVLLSTNRDRIARLTRRAQEGYVQPLPLRWSGSPNPITCQVIPLGKNTSAGPAWAALFLDDRRFVEETVARKIAEMDDGNFIFAVKQNPTGEWLFSTTQDPPTLFEKRETLWVIPDLDLWIKLRGYTLSEISRARTRRNLLFIGMVNVLLIAGLVYLIRNISQEMALAQMKTDFVANVSHELRTPLSLIRMYAETLEMGRITDEGKRHHYYRTIMNESARLTQLINNILDFSRIESRKKKYTLTEEPLAPLVRETLEAYRSHLEQKGFVVQVHIEEDLPPVWIDPDSIRLAFINLLDNAIKFSPDRKEIHMDLHRENLEILLDVMDFGIGIPESEQERIFDKFYRVGSSLVHETRGSGLGLSLVKHIMEIHHGEVRVASKPGTGSRFTLVFPLNGARKGL